MTKSKMFVAVVAISAAIATPAFAQWQWQSQEPAAYASMYPNGDRTLASPATRETMAFVPTSKSPRPMVMRATKGK
jgi:Tfp pilus assembly protein PilE